MLVPRFIAEARYEASAANCCTRLFESQCGITYRTSS